MGREIIKQPNGKYAVFSSVIDNFIFVNVTKEEYIKFRVKEETMRIEASLLDLFLILDKGENPYPNYEQHTFEEALNWIEEVHGKEEKLKILNVIKNDS
jgi:hypothetical protein